MVQVYTWWTCILNLLFFKVKFLFSHIIFETSTILLKKNEQINQIWLIMLNNLGQIKGWINIVLFSFYNWEKKIYHVINEQILHLTAIEHSY